MKVIFLDVDGVLNSVEWMKKNPDDWKTTATWPHTWIGS